MNTGSCILEGFSNKSISLDYYYTTNNTPKPIVVFAHGFKGFKDWGHWKQVGLRFAAAGFVFIKFNFSHNGTTIEKPTEFADLEAFGQNNYTKELFDLNKVINWISDNKELSKTETDTSNITIIGHSRGGPIAIFEAARNPKISQVVTWASVHQLGFERQSEQQLAKWKEKGVYYILNGRTYQEMPLYYQLFEDFEANRDLFDVRKTLETLRKSLLIMHGDSDPAVPLFSAKRLKEWYPDAQLHILKGADHVFGGRHPFIEEALPDASKELVDETVKWIKSRGKS